MMYGHLKLLVLKALTRKPMSGYSLMNEIQETIGGCKPSCGSIYPLLDDLSQEKLVTITIEGRKKIYALTQTGKEEFKRIKVEKDKLIDNILELWNVFDSVSEKNATAKKYSYYMVNMLTSIKKGDLPFKEIFPEKMETDLNLMRLYHDHKLSYYKKDLKRIFEKLNKNLRKLV